MRRTGIVIAFLALVAIFAAGVWQTAFTAALGPLARRGEADLALASDRLTQELQGFRELAVLMADHPALSALVTGTGSAEAALPLLRRVAVMTGSLDLIVLDAAGRELAHASETEPRDHGDAAYLARALDGALGVGHGLSERYGRRIFSFAAPVFSVRGPAIGAVVAVVDIEALEAGWRGDRPTVWFSDPAGTVFVSNRSELIFRAREGTGESGFFTYRSRLIGGHETWQVDGGPYLPRRALHLTRSLPAIGLTGEALLDLAPARQIATLQAAVAATLCLAFGSLLFVAAERRRALARLNSALEARVRRRTGQLVAANGELEREVAERRETEARLRRAQAELVQAAKLSALGQMSAGIAHELNQPLMAIRSFAENAEGYLARGEGAVAAANLGRIGDLAHRMGRIIKALRAFARQESEPPRAVDLGTVIAGVCDLAAPRARAAGVQLRWEPSCAVLTVRAGEVRLSQVILNLVTNAIDAMGGADRPADEAAGSTLGAREVSISACAEGGRVIVEVRDTGPGIAEPDRIFDPFYTTKPVVEDGIGLGLSISYGLVQSFGGAIRGRNHPGGGAVFTVELDAAEPAALAEEAA